MAEPKTLVAYGQRCLICRNDAAESRTICWKHIDDIRDMLDPLNKGRPLDDLPASIPVMYAALDPSPGATGLGERRAPGFASTPPLRLHVVAMRDDRSRPPLDDDDDPVRATGASLRGIVEAVCAELDRPPPQLGRDVLALCVWLFGFLRPLTRLAWADDLYRDLRELRDQLRHAVGDPAPRPLGHCTADILLDRETGERGPCGHPLYPPAGLPPTARDEPVKDVPVVECRRCRSQYDGLAQLRLRIAELEGSG